MKLIVNKQHAKSGILSAVLVAAVLLCVVKYTGKVKAETPKEYALTVSKDCTMGAVYDCNGNWIAKGESPGIDTYNKDYAAFMGNVIGADIWSTRNSGYTVRGKCSQTLYGLTQNQMKSFHPFRQKTGGDVVLTLDGDLQNTCGKLLAEKGYETAAILVMDYHSGEILAAAGTPTFDLQNAGQLKRDADGVVEDQRAWNLCFTGNLMLGSTVKPLLFAALLDLRPDLVDYQYSCVPGNHSFGADGTVIQCAGDASHGTLSMTGALGVSCNGYAVSVAGQVPEEELLSGLERFGFDQVMSLPNNLSFTDLTYYGKAQDLTENSKLMSRIGGSNCRGSLLSVATAYSALFREGNAVSPYLIAAVSKESKGEQVPVTRGADIPMCSAQSANQILEMMKGVADHGTCRNLKDLGVLIAAKSGTANQEDGSNVLWTVAGIVEESHPYLVVTCIDKAPATLSCAEGAGSITKAVLQTLLEREVKK